MDQHLAAHWPAKVVLLLFALHQAEQLDLYCETEQLSTLHWSFWTWVLNWTLLWQEALHESDQDWNGVKKLAVGVIETPPGSVPTPGTDAAGGLVIGVETEGVDGLGVVPGLFGKTGGGETSVIGGVVHLKAASHWVLVAPAASFAQSAQD